MKYIDLDDAREFEMTSELCQGLKDGDQDAIDTVVLNCYDLIQLMILKNKMIIGTELYYEFKHVLQVKLMECIHKFDIDKSTNIRAFVYKSLSNRIATFWKRHEETKGRLIEVDNIIYDAASERQVDMCDLVSVSDIEGTAYVSEAQMIMKIKNILCDKRYSIFEDMYFHDMSTTELMIKHEYSRQALWHNIKSIRRKLKHYLDLDENDLKGRRTTRGK